MEQFNLKLFEVGQLGNIIHEAHGNLGNRGIDNMLKLQKKRSCQLLISMVFHITFYCDSMYTYEEILMKK
jgi:hypothetical protein